MSYEYYQKGRRWLQTGSLMKQLIRYLVGKEKVDPTRYTTCQQQIDNPVYQTKPQKSMMIGMGGIIRHLMNLKLCD
jgi:LPS O-antigen subunit length determinant protein (WzzB/FepE family)